MQTRCKRQHSHLNQCGSGIRFHRSGIKEQMGTSGNIHSQFQNALQQNLKLYYSHENVENWCSSSKLYYHTYFQSLHDLQPITSHMKLTKSSAHT